MHREQLTWLRLGAVLTDGAVLLCTWVAVVHMRATFHLWWPLDLFTGDTLLAEVSSDRALRLGWLLIPAWLLALYEVGSYVAMRRKSPYRVARELLVASALALAGVIALIFLMGIHPASRTLILSFGAVSLVPMAITRWAQLWLLGRLRAANFDPYRILVVGQGDVSPFTDALQRHHSWGIAVVGTTDVDGLTGALIAEPIDEVYLTGGLASERIAEVAGICDELGVPLSLEANFVGLRATQAVLDDYDGWTLLTVRSSPGASIELAIKRGMDLCLSTLLLGLASPLLGLTYVLVRWHDGGSALHIQERMGRYGRPFQMIKFRTMVPDAEAQLAELQAHNEVSGPAFKMRDDPRVTKVGHWLRRLSIDELPQLWNVIRGEMSLVGPRPPLPGEVVNYERWQLRRLSMKPGITCSWQVSGRSDIDFERWMALDLEYIDNWNLWLDVRLLARTVPAVIRGTGAR